MSNSLNLTLPACFCAKYLENAWHRMTGIVKDCHVLTHVGVSIIFDVTVDA